MRIPVAGIPRFPGAGSSARGQPAPKARPKGVADGQRVNIPALSGEVEPRGARGGNGRELRMLAAARVNRVAEGVPRDSAPRAPPRREKPRGDEPDSRTKTDTGGRVRRRTKARERNLVKELGNIAP